MTLFAGIDVGTGGARCIVVDERGERVAAGSRRWTYGVDAHGFATLDVREVLDAVHDAIAHALAGRDASDIAAAGVTAQRTGVVLLDAEGNEIILSPNADGRGALHGIAMEKQHRDLVYRVAGRLPVLIYPPARLAWFRSERQDLAAKVARALSLSDWLVWCMTGVARTEPTQAAEMLCFDVAAGRWSEELMRALDVPAAFLPPVGEAGTAAGACTNGVLRDVPVVAAGADTQVGALALGITEPGEGVVVAGTTMICETVLAGPDPDPDGRAWCSPHAIPGRFVREVHCGEAGAALEWLARSLGVSVPDLAAAAASEPAGASGMTFVDAGPSNASDFSLVRRGGFIVTAPLLALGGERGCFARAAFEGLAFAAAAGLEELRPRSIAATGGLVRSDLFPRVLADALGRPVRVATEHDAGALGAAIVAAASHHGGVREATNAMHDRGREVTPDDTDGYAAHYATWKQRVAELEPYSLKVSML